MPTFATNIGGMADASSQLRQIGAQIAQIADEVRSGITASTQEFDGQTAIQFAATQAAYQVAHAALTENTGVAATSAGNIGETYGNNEARSSSLWPS